MAIPGLRELEIPILQVLRDAGGLLPSADAARRVAERFRSKLTLRELQARNKTGTNVFKQRIHFARLKLVHAGEVERAKYGVWGITEKGLARLTREGVTQRAEDTPTAPLPVEQDTHLNIQLKLEELGGVLGKYARRHYRETGMTFDVVWKETSTLRRASHVFEVQHKGNVVEALARLKHAFDIWRSQLFLVITSESDRQRAEALLQEAFSGTFHEIASDVTVLTPTEVDEIYQVVKAHRDIISKLASR
jgi:hypothetical protein